jgi:hypothetical protein
MVSSDTGPTQSLQLQAQMPLHCSIPSCMERNLMRKKTSLPRVI